MKVARFKRADLIAIAVGGLIGATVRWIMTDATAGSDSDGGWFAYAPNTSVGVDFPLFEFPWRTLMVNLIGCVLLGAIYTFRKQSLGNRRLMLGAATGLCGSLTTFSTFAVEVATRLRFTGVFTVGTNVEGFDAAGSGQTLTSGPSPFAQGLLYLVVSIVGAGFAFNMGRQAATRGET